MRRRWLALPLLLLLLTGCWSRLELNDLGLVLGMGIDTGEEERVRLTLYFVRTTGGEAGGKPVGGDPIWVVSREADNLSDAMREISMASARRISLNHVRVVLIGEELAREGLRGLADFLARNPQIRLSTRAMVIRGRAQTALETLPQLKALQPENLVGILQARGGIEWQLKQFLVARVSDTHSGWMHAVSVIERPAGVPQTPPTAAIIGGAGLFRGDRLVEMLDMREGQILSWLVGNPRQAVISAPCPDTADRTFSVEVDQGSVQIRPVRAGDDLAIEVTVRGSVNLIRLGCPASMLDPAVRTQLERQMQEDVSARFAETIARFQASGTDPVGFGKRVQLAYPAYWEQIKRQWPEIWPDLPVTVTARVDIDHAGLLTQPATRTEEELERGE